MFDKISFREESPEGGPGGLDLGAIAEALVFYGEVQIVGARGVLLQLTKACGPEVLTELVSSGFLTVVFQPNFAVVKAQNMGTPNELLDAGMIEAPALSVDRVLLPLFEEALGKRGKARRLANRFLSHTTVRRIPEELAEQFKADFRSQAWVQEVASTVLHTLVPQTARASTINFELVTAGDLFRAVTNVDFIGANEEYHRRVSAEHSTITPSLLVASLVHARELAYSAALDGIELGVTGLDAALVQGLLGRALTSPNSRSQIESFNDFVFDDGRAIRKAINTGQRTFRDLLPVIERGKRFRSWLQGIPPDGEIVKEYFREVTKETWIDSLPARSIRWALFTAAGIGVDALIGSPGIATAAGAGIGLGDTFLVDRIVKGWRPDQFVHGALTDFVKPDVGAVAADKR